MAPRPKLSRFTAQLPATPCREEMKAAIQHIAEIEDASVAEIQRRAYALFLLKNGSNTTKKGSNTPTLSLSSEN